MRKKLLTIVDTYTNIRKLGFDLPNTQKYIQQCLDRNGNQKQTMWSLIPLEIIEKYAQAGFGIMKTAQGL